MIHRLDALRLRERVVEPPAKPDRAGDVRRVIHRIDIGRHRGEPLDLIGVGGIVAAGEAPGQIGLVGPTDARRRMHEGRHAADVPGPTRRRDHRQRARPAAPDTRMRSALTSGREARKLTPRRYQSTQSSRLLSSAVFQCV